jgi:hypothetical protein
MFFPLKALKTNFIDPLVSGLSTNFESITKVFPLSEFGGK